MSNTKMTRNGQTYDFSRCSKEQLAEYAKIAIAFMDSRIAGTQDGPYTIALLAAARVERKEDVARELADFLDGYTSSSSEKSIGTYGTAVVRELADRYRRAV
jgi:hypothetical protein